MLSLKTTTKELGAGHTLGIVGDFVVRATGETDPFAAAVVNFSRQLANPDATLLERPILSPEEWLDDQYYSGPIKRELWPQKLDDFYAIAQGDITEIALTGAIGTGKSQLLKLVCMYDLYRLSCFASPQLALGVTESETLLFVVVSLNVTKAKAKLFEPLRRALDQSLYFRKEFPYDSQRKSTMDFPKNLRVMPGVTGEASVHSEDVVWLGISEANFLPVVEQSKKKRGVDRLDVAKDLAEATVRRMKSRFQQGGKLPLCRIIFDSSRQYPEDFLERRIAEIEQGNVGHKAVVIARSAWEARRGVRDAAGNLYYSGESFPVEVGTENRFSRILDEDEVPLAKGQIIRIPEELREEFERDVEGSLRDFGGVAVLGMRVLIKDRAAIIDCVREEERGFQERECLHPMSSVTTTLSDNVRLLERLLINPETKRPYVNPDRPRTAHVDVGLTTDCCGVSMGHVEKMVKISRGKSIIDLEMGCFSCESDGRLQCDRCKGSGKSKQFGVPVQCCVCRGAGHVLCAACNGTGKHGVPVDRPMIYMDFMLRIVPSVSGQIQIDDIEALLQRLRNIGFFIPVVTADGYQSAQFLQRQQSQYGVPFAEVLSVDKSKDPYYAHRDAILDKVPEENRRRLSFYYYEPYIGEITHVEDRPAKIDHCPGGQKDLADSVTGVIWNCERFPVLQTDVTHQRLDVRTL